MKFWNELRISNKIHWGCLSWPQARKRYNVREQNVDGIIWT